LAFHKKSCWRLWKGW